MWLTVAQIKRVFATCVGSVYGAKLTAKLKSTETIHLTNWKKKMLENKTWYRLVIQWNITDIFKIANDKLITTMMPN